MADVNNPSLFRGKVESGELHLYDLFLWRLDLMPFFHTGEPFED